VSGVARPLSRIAPLWCALAAVAAAAPEERLVDIARSTVTVHVFTDGPLQAAGGSYLIQAPLTEGTVEEAPTPHVQVVIDARRLRVVDASLSAKDRAEMQTRTLGPEVLDVSRFPRIHYHSITMERRAADWLIHGELELHGLILPVKATVRRNGGRYQGSATVRPSDFGIVPVSLRGGLVAVKDEVTIEFDIVTQAPR
jgi:polyisoprenoid-binding protein YceI